MLNAILKGYGVDEQTVLNISSRLSIALDSIEKISYILEREYGKVPPVPVSADEDIVTAPVPIRPVIQDGIDLAGEHEFSVAKLAGAPCSKGFIRNIGQSKLKIRWASDEDKAYYPAFTLEPGETLEFDGVAINRIKLEEAEPGVTYSVKFILR